MGTRSFALRLSAFDADTALAGFVVAWTRGDGLFSVITAGVPGTSTEDETRSLARTMDGRAAAA